MNSSSIQRSIHLGVAVLFLFAVTWLAALPTAARADAVTDWDVIAFDAVDASGMTGPVTALPITMAHLAMSDALNAIDRRYKPYAFDAAAPHGASPEAAVAAAAHGVLIVEIPNQKTALDAALASALAAIPGGKAKADGVAIGQAAAAAILARRANDGSDIVTPFTPGVKMGAWRPLATAIGAPIGLGFGAVTPFTMASSTQFGPPKAASFDLTSAEYAADYNEVKSLGGANSTTRTAEQSEIAKFWYEPSPGVHIRLARDLVASQKLNLWESARLFALLNLACTDSLIASYDAKYRYNFWRPVTAIQNGANDGNPLTTADPAWNSFLETPNHPDYPSNHAVLSATCAEVMARFFGSDRFNFTVTSAEPFPGMKRSFNSFWQSAKEAADSRVYAGIHFRTASNEGLKLGRKIGEHVFTDFLQPVIATRAAAPKSHPPRATPARQ
ncbi:MAG: vanadium-dependent haloperoxidase [Blastocatellales bacterium]